MDTSDPDIAFDAAGNCQHCTGWFERAKIYSIPAAERMRRLNELVVAMKQAGRGREYDCLIGVSGGVDSSFVAMKVKELGLRALAVHVDNGWNSEMAVGNIKRLLEKLEIDLYTTVLDWREFRALQLAFLRASTPDSEIPSDHAIVSTFYNAARKHRIRYYISGINFRTEGIHARQWSQGHLDRRYIASVYRQFAASKLKHFPLISINTLVRSVVFKRPRAVFLLDYLDYNKAVAKALLIEEFGWQDYGGKHYESVYTRFYQGWLLPTKFGYDKRRMHLSTLICSGEVTREQALGELETPPYPTDWISRDIEFVSKKLGISVAEFEAIMALPKKNYMDYPNLQNHAIFSLGIDAYRWLKHRARLIRDI
jgi:N-acetyl sugar amidotransferase